MEVVAGYVCRVMASSDMRSGGEKAKSCYASKQSMGVQGVVLATL